MIAAFLLWSGQRRCAMDAMEYFTFRRTANYDPKAGFGAADDESDAYKALNRKKPKANQGPEGPSQVLHSIELA